MPILTVLPLNRRVPYSTGETVLQILRRIGVDVESPCDGRGSCGKCRVRVEGCDVAPTPHRDLSDAETRAGVRLACRLNPSQDMALHLDQTYRLDGRVLEGGGLEAAQVYPAARVAVLESGPWLEYQGSANALLDPWAAGSRPKGVAVDLGTTTIVVTLIDLETGKVLGKASGVNPQVRFGHDVLSRIQRASTPEGLTALATTARDEINRLIRETCHAAGAAPAEVVDVVIGANPTMLQIAAQIDPRPLGVAPFLVSLHGGESRPASEFGLALNAASRVYVPPVAHAFVGSDISAGLLAAEFFDKEGPVLFLDLGTNGELALTVEGRRYVTSAAAGPAFEGMGISRGMRASAGAIETVRVVGEELEVDVIGGGAAVGICGSGLLDLMACLVRLGVVDRGGRIVRPLNSASSGEASAGTMAISVAPGVQFTQTDVRQLQLAKGAVRTAIDLLLAAAGTTPEALKEVILAGAFGYHIRPASMEAIGLLPPETASRVTFAGNTSATGAGLLLLDGRLRTFLERSMRSVEHLGLPNQREFQRLFLANLAFP